MTPAQAALVVVAALAGALLAGRAALGEDGRARQGWGLVAVAAALSAAAGALAIVGQEAGVAAALATSTMVSAVGVVRLLPQSASRFALLHSILDGVILLSALLFMGWAVLLDQLVAGRGAWGVIEALAHPLSAIVLLTAVLVMLTKPHRHASLWWILLAGGLAAQAGGELGAIRVELAGGTGAGWLRALAIGAGWALAARAAASRDVVVRTRARNSAVARLSEAVAPLIPVFATVAVAIDRIATDRLDRFLRLDGLMLGVLLGVRYLVAQLDNFRLAEEMERRVAMGTMQLERQERQFKTVVHHASDVITIVDGSGIILFQSGSAERLLGYGSGELVGTRVEGLFSGDEAAHVMTMLRSAPRPPEMPITSEVRVRARSGVWVLCELSASNLLHDEGVQGILVTTRDITVRRELETQLRQQALHDPLTGLGNRVLFTDRLEHAVDRARRSGNRLGVLMLDLDGFKQVNDSLGHAAGDELLTEVALRLTDAVRTTDTVARMGGDEFAILLEGPDEGQHLVVAQRIVNRLRAPVKILGRPLVVQGSVGAAAAVGASLSAEDLLRAADLAMYRAKSMGKGTVMEYEPSMQAAARHRVEIESDLRRGMQAGELVLHYQPIVELTTGRISGCEALVRWAHPRRGLVPPGEFLAVADDSDIGLRLGRWVLSEACRQARAFADSFPSDPPLTMAVNLSSAQLSSAWLVSQVTEAIAEAGIPASMLVLEIVESALMSEEVAILDTLAALAEVGVGLAIDDFGTGWSSLSRLRSFPVHKLKIDRSFISEITSADDEAPIVAAIVAMAHSLGLTTVAEGVETFEQLACLGHHNCEEVQGWVIAKAVAADQFLDLLARDPDEMVPIEAKPRSRSEREFADLVTRAAKQAVAAEVVPPALAHLHRMVAADAIYLARVSWESSDEEVLFAMEGSVVPVGAHLSWSQSPDSTVVAGGARVFDDLAEIVPEHDLVKTYRLRGYASVPLELPGGRVYGTLCVATLAPGALDSGVVALLELFARLLVDHLPASHPTIAARRQPLVKPVSGLGSR